MALGCASPALIRSQGGCPPGLAVKPEDKPKDAFIIDEPDMNAHILLQAALFSRDISIPEVGQDDVALITKGGALLNGIGR